MMLTKLIRRTGCQSVELFARTKIPSSSCRWAHLAPAGVQGKEENSLEDKIIYNSLIGGQRFRMRQKKLEKLKKESSCSNNTSSLSHSFLSAEARAHLLGMVEQPGEGLKFENDDLLSLQKLMQEKRQVENLSNEAFRDISLDFMTSTSSDPSLPASRVPCGGCGAPLHCQDPEYPGFLPLECFKGVSEPHLRALTCQRCYTLKNHHKAIHVDVSPDEYPKILEHIRDKRALVLLVVDLMDFPCSIWPHLSQIIGSRRPICVVGNKVDLLPNDGKFFLERVKESLTKEVIRVSGIGENYIKHVALVSAKTGYGIEALINKLHNNWRVQGDVYVVGCTNVGKSSIFNALLDSDYCKVQASNLVQRATISNWPGTTLNLLKFPILRPSHQMLFDRTARLISEKVDVSIEMHEEKELLRKTRDIEHATLRGHVRKTYELSQNQVKDPFKLPSSRATDFTPPAGINPEDEAFLQSRWCFDTPGVVYPDQVINLLTEEELEKVIPKAIISPRSFSLLAGQTLFLAGLGRVDYLHGTSNQIIVTIFSSDHLPITICETTQADEVYQTYAGSDLLVVPSGSEERLAMWPGLKKGLSAKFEGIHSKESVADVLFSSAGWMSVTLPREKVAELEIFTPLGLGIHVRKPSMLPFAVARRGRRIERTPAYEKFRPVL
ncbi:nitric oxide-associated protein 1 [Cloeon dipterum]|uniref:nitric oxide-associated protein 1 n=1 Tax=Cloeon dipterum TaxID=197152 RepID=UPI00321FE9D6